MSNTVDSPYSPSMNSTPGQTNIASPVTSIQSVDRSGNIFVAGLNSSLDDQALEELFSEFGTILTAKVMLDVKTGMSRGFGFVMFGSSVKDGKPVTGEESEALAIQAMHGKLLPDGHTLSVQKSVHDGKQALVESNVVYVRNLPLEMTERECAQFFEQYGVIVSCTIRQDNTLHNTGSGKFNLASLQFATIEAARECIKCVHGQKNLFPGSNATVLAKFGETLESREMRRSKRRTNPSPSQPPLGLHPVPLALDSRVQNTASMRPGAVQIPIHPRATTSPNVGALQPVYVFPVNDGVMPYLHVSPTSQSLATGMLSPSANSPAISPLNLGMPKQMHSPPLATFQLQQQIAMHQLQQQFAAQNQFASHMLGGGAPGQNSPQVIMVMPANSSHIIPRS